MRRVIALVVIGIVIIGVAALWVLIPGLTENDEPVAGSTTTGSTSTTATAATPVDPSTTTTSTTLPPVPTGGTAVLGVVGEPLSLNPILTGGNAPVVETLSELWTVGLIELEPKTHDPVPGAVTEIPTVENGGLALNDDGTMTVTYHLDRTLTWDNGDPLTGLDVAATYDILTDPALPIRPDLRSLHSLIVPGSVTSTEDSATVTLQRPTIRYLSLFPILVPASQVAESDFANDWNTQTWMSAGPFVFESWESGSTVRFARNDQYGAVDERGGRLPYLDAVEVMFFSGDEALLAAFRLQTVDAAPIAADPMVLTEFEGSPSIDLQVAAGPEYEHLGFEFGPGRFEANPGSMNESREFREFVARAMDRPAIIADVLQDRVPVLNTVVGMSWPAAGSTGWSEYIVDEATQTALLATARTDLGRDAVRIDLATSASLERTQIAGAFLQRLAASGASVDIELLELGEFFRDRVLPGTFDIGQWAWRASPGPVGAVTDLEDRFRSLPEDGGYNFYRWGATGSAPSERAAEVRERIAALDGILDIEELRTELEAIDSLLAEGIVVVPMYGVPNAAAVWVTAFEGFDHVAAFPDTWNAAFWHRIGE